jgi:hypothetical protein
VHVELAGYKSDLSGAYLWTIPSFFHTSTSAEARCSSSEARSTHQCMFLCSGTVALARPTIKEREMSLSQYGSSPRLLPTTTHTRITSCETVAESRWLKYGQVVAQCDDSNPDRLKNSEQYWTATLVIDYVMSRKVCFPASVDSGLEFVNGFLT